MDPFTVENECLTPTFKIKRYAKPPATTIELALIVCYRKETYAKYKKELDALYAPTSAKL